MSEIVQKPIPTCDNHPSDEVEVYCKQCNKGVCFDCYRIHHHNHDCEGIVKLSRRLRQQIPETCRQIKDGTLSKMKSELESIKTIQMDYKEKSIQEVSSLDNLQASCIKAVTKVFQTEKEKLSEKLKRHSNNLKVREQDLATSIENLTVHVQAHQDSQLTYGKFEIVEMDVQLKRMIDSYRPLDTEGSTHTSATKSQIASSLMERIQISVKDILTDILPSNKLDDEEEYAVFEVSSSINVRISVVDIIKVEAEAIVCPQDVKCQSTGGVAKAIHSVADQLYRPGEKSRLSDMMIADVAVLETLDKIKWKYVFHVVPPRWQGSNASNSGYFDRNLGFTYRTILCRAKEFDVHSIVVPLLGFGDSGYKYVLEKNSDIFPEELEFFPKSLRKAFPLDIHIVCNDKTALSTMVKGCSKRFH